MTYRVKSLNLATGFEALLAPSPLPVEITTGIDPRLSIVEGGFEQAVDRFILRAVHTRAQVGVHVTQTRPSMRMGIVLAVDPASERHWNRRAERRARGRELRGLPAMADPREEPTADRLINVEIDGLLRHQILLPSCAHEARHRAESLIDLTAGEVEAIRETKHLMVSLSAGGAEDAGDRGRTDGLVGVRVNALSLREAVDVPQPTVSTGAPVAAGVAMIRPETGYAVINAAGPEDAVEVDARWQPTRRGRFRTFSGSRPEIAVRATDVHGRQVDIDVVQSSADGLRLQIPAGSGPVHLRFEGRRGAQIPEVGLRARTLRGPTEP